MLNDLAAIMQRLQALRGGGAGGPLQGSGRVGGGGMGAGGGSFRPDFFNQPGNSLESLQGFFSGISGENGQLGTPGVAPNVVAPGAQVNPAAVQRRLAGR